ncbi:tyrosine-type recombinase/integrase [Variovorax paradoxus]|uniref:tyrosine-type recombinase/integrase n=1 Tax=Variovorax paradoxus TaxID=34073 RepID=UPI0019344A43|nr:tyrosine-type recombinase/integrase [Variovorax paradoxus]
MGRRRKSALDLEQRVYFNHGAFYYVHQNGKWERLGTDKDEANRKARIHNDPESLYGTMVYWLDQFLLHCAKRVHGGTLKQRTYDDYEDAIVPPTETRTRGALRTFFAPPRTPLDVTPAMVQDFLITMAELGRPTPANRERACLSACFSWLLRTGKVPGLLVNPCLRASGVQRNKETRRTRYVTHDEFKEVYAVAGASERLMMELAYRTLQRPESDIVYWTSENLVKEGGKRLLKHRQNKTGTDIVIELPKSVNDLLDRALGTEDNIVKLRQPLVHRLDGEAYDYDGLSSMLRRSIAVANERRKARKKEPMASFGFRDLKGKGATDMWLAGVPIERIQLLCGHKSKATTEVYIKQRWRETAQPNLIEMS